MKQVTIKFEIIDYGCTSLIDDNVRQKLENFISYDGDISDYNLNLEIILDSEAPSTAFVTVNDVDLGTSGNDVYFESKLSLNRFYEYSGKLKDLLLCEVTPGITGQITFYF